MKTDTLIFDLDGTLWDGVDAYVGGFNDFFKSKNINRIVTRADLFNYMGIEENEFLEAILPEFARDERNNMYRQIVRFQYNRIEHNGGVLYKDVIEGLTNLARKYQLFIVSNCPEHTIAYFMKWSKINHLITDTIAHGANHKSKHENISLLIKKHGVKSAVYIGDTDGDRIQCEIIKIPFVYVSYGFGESVNYSLKFDSFKQLESYFLKKLKI